MRTEKRCTCGNGEFNCVCLSQTYSTVGDTREWNEDVEYDEFAAVGPYICTDCGKKYAKWDDIPDAAGDMSDSSFDAVFVEKPLDEGWNSADIVHMLHVLDTDEFLPIEVENSNGSSVAIGLISKVVADNVLCFDYHELSECVRAVLDDMDLENPKEVYSVCGLNVVVTRDLAHFASQV